MSERAERAARRLEAAAAYAPGYAAALLNLAGEIRDCATGDLESVAALSRGVDGARWWADEIASAILDEGAPGA